MYIVSILITNDFYLLPKSIIVFTIKINIPDHRHINMSMFPTVSYDYLFMRENVPLLPLFVLFSLQTIICKLL